MENLLFVGVPILKHIRVIWQRKCDIYIRAREIVGFTCSGPIFETENRFVSRQEAKILVHKKLYFSRFCSTQNDIVTCQSCSHLIISCYLS